MRVCVQHVVEGFRGCTFHVSEVKVIGVGSVQVFVDLVLDPRSVEALVVSVQLRGVLDRVQLLLHLLDVARQIQTAMLFVVFIFFVIDELVAPFLDYCGLVSTIIVWSLQRLLAALPFLLVLLQ